MPSKLKGLQCAVILYVFIGIIPPGGLPPHVILGVLLES